METKTCHKCGLEKPRDAEHFSTKRKTRSDGSEHILITSPCRLCCLKAAAQKRKANPGKDSRRVIAWREKNGREDRSVEYRNRSEARALAAGFGSSAQRNRSKAINRLAHTLRQLAKRRDPPTFCWVWARPGITPKDRFSTRYRLDAEFRAREIVRSKMRKAHIRMATPPWVDHDDLARVYQGRPDGHHVDHFVPLKGVTPDGAKVSGLNVPWNLRYLPGPENIARSNRMTPGELHAVECSLA